MTGSIVVRPAVTADGSALADLHRSVFPDYASTRLGVGFCRRLIGRYLSDPGVLVLLAPGPSPADEPVGYLIGCPPPIQQRINDSLAGWGAWAVAGQLARSPRRSVEGAGDLAARARSAVRPLARRVRPGVTGGRAGPASGTAAGTAADFLGPVGVGAAPTRSADVRVVLVGVAPTARGRGVADTLLAAFAADAVARGHARADLVVAAGNDAAHRAYERAGWQRVAPDRFVLDLTG